MNTQKKAPKRYNLVMPDDLAKALETAAEQERTTLVHFLRQCIKLGLFVHAIRNDPDSAILIKRGDKTEKIVFI